MSDQLRSDDRAPNLLVGDGVEIAASARIGANVVILDNCVIGADADIQHGVILGRQPSLAATSSASRERSAGSTVEPGAIVCAGAIVFAGARIGKGAIVGDQSHVRERAELGAGSVLGRGSALGPDAKVGANVRIQTMVWLTTGVIVEDDVFIGPGVVTMNDNAIGRRGDAPLVPPVFRRGCRVGGGVLVTPGIEIGEEAFIASGAVVTKSVAARDKVMGMPARVVGAVDPNDPA